MKRRDLLRHLTDRSLLRKGGSHSWWHNEPLNKRSAVPLLNEINDHLAARICKVLGVPPP